MGGNQGQLLNLPRVWVGTVSLTHQISEGSSLNLERSPKSHI